MNIYSFYNNKGGIGKTTLCSHVAPLYAKNNPDTQVLLIDMCPQANLSQFLLGGAEKGYKTIQELQTTKSRKNIVGFIDWIINGNVGFSSLPYSFKVQIHPYNSNIPKNIYLIAGDSFLESLSLALNYAVINPADTKAWKKYMIVIRKLCEEEFTKDRYDKITVFIDCNPSFSIYTQMALLSSDKIIIPMMADYSSVEGVKGIFMLLYGKYPSVSAEKFASNVMTFSKQVSSFGMELPIIHEFVFNNYTSNLGVAKAYESIRNDLIKFCYEQYNQFPELFNSKIKNITSREDFENYYVSDVKDFHTAGKISASLGIPLYILPEHTKYSMPDGESVKVETVRYKEALDHIKKLANKIE
ncbi:MAG: ParA family protein [Candidatus Marithrix sp.]